MEGGAVNIRPVRTEVRAIRRSQGGKYYILLPPCWSTLWTRLRTGVVTAGTIGPRHLQQEIFRSPGLLSLQQEEERKEKERLEKEPAEEVREDMVTRGRKKKLGSGSDLSQEERIGE